MPYHRFPPRGSEREAMQWQASRDGNNELWLTTCLTAIAGAAGFATMKAYESHLRATGQQPSHVLMKDILAGIAAAEVDKLVETNAGGTGWEYAQSQGGYASEHNYGGGAPWGAPCHGGYAAYGGGYDGGYQQAPRGYYPPPQAYPPQQPYYQQQGCGQPEYEGYRYEGEHHRRHSGEHHHEEHHHHHRHH
ncbi:hypothetical protein JB92DRAFT_3103911 [Gautieria morchelliformis]|nr:hypothetical protein JB92DRAFT_3103911 [Gautieria morchelliformis]